MNVISTIVTVTNVFCAPAVVGCNGDDTIDDFIFQGELLTQINNQATGCAANGYDNRTQYSVSLAGNKSYTVLVSTQYGINDIFAIWIDFDDNCVFTSSERVAYLSSTPTSDTAVTVTIPPIGLGASTGVHRMRATISYSVPPTPCSATTSYGETHDYTVNILTYTRK